MLRADAFLPCKLFFFDAGSACPKELSILRPRSSISSASTLSAQSTFEISDRCSPSPGLMSFANIAPANFSLPDNCPFKSGTARKNIRQNYLGRSWCPTAPRPWHKRREQDYRGKIFSFELMSRRVPLAVPFIVHAVLYAANHSSI